MRRRISKQSGGDEGSIPSVVTKMTIIPTQEKPKKRAHSQPEAKIQASAVQWLWNNYPETRGNYIHIPNEGNRASQMDGALRKSLGLVAGAPDTFLFLARNGYHGLAVEFKTETGVQSDAQKEFQKRLELNGYRYEICRSLEQFKEIIYDYLK